uniref:Tyr recombinase domain-containing protein n=1 Tax=Caenorhabditis japonica TaxID=281687 RepID=A0A8R1I705_CAEJA
MTRKRGVQETHFQQNIFPEGKKQQFIEELRTIAGTELSHVVDFLEDAPYGSKAFSTAKAYKTENSKRAQWTIKRNLPQNESSLLLYLGEKARTIGSSALGKIAAAYRVTNDGMSGIASSLISDLLKWTRRTEIDFRKPKVEVTIADVKKITDMAMSSNDPAADRDALLAILSFHAMLRASEAADLRWDGITRRGNTIELKVDKAKNDQMALGRSSFIEYTPGSDADILMCKWRLANGEKCSYVFSNLAGTEKLSAPSISALASRMLKKIGKEGATHHCFRRGGANHLRELGLSLEQVAARGRWRSIGGLQRYLKDVPTTQGVFQEVDDHN